MKKLICILSFLLFPASAATAADKTVPAAKKNEIKIILFGQPCLMSGPYDVATLNAIHAISPEKIPPPASSHQASLLLDRVGKASKLPAAFDLYRERLVKFLDSQVILLGKDKKKPPAAPSPGPSPSAEAYSEESINEIPEEDFHRAARKSGVEYTCVFGEDQ
ncbi:MAG: hypothetical protein A2583_05410 [Bdellovibrionales bacterium RIFOXYD1_FULL_53_11]|nr:MAG: hypothetical protein A2583_05410 [Bdellovibrionales bacterium RIFOXYD1_FULL_53_11]